MDDFDTLDNLDGKMPRQAVASSGRRNAINTKITDELRARLETMAAENGRTLSGEIETRLEQSFLASDMMEKLFGGPATFSSFQKTAAFLQARAAERYKTSGDAWAAKADFDFAEEIADGLRQLLEFDINMAAPYVPEPDGAAEVDQPLSNDVRFETPEERAAGWGVMLKRNSVSAEELDPPTGKPKRGRKPKA